MSRQTVLTPIGPLLALAGEEGLFSLLPGRAGEEAPDEITEETARQLREYFEGRRKAFTVPLAPRGTEFQKAVWKKLREVPYGKVASYGDLAAALGRPEAARAAANALGKNPILILQPCHRIVAARGLGGFTGGLSVKRALLSLEDVEISENTRFSQKYFFTFL